MTLHLNNLLNTLGLGGVIILTLIAVVLILFAVTSFLESCKRHKKRMERLAQQKADLEEYKKSFLSLLMQDPSLIEHCPTPILADLLKTYYSVELALTGTTADIPLFDDIQAYLKECKYYYLPYEENSSKPFSSPYLIIFPELHLYTVLPHKIPCSRMSTLLKLPKDATLFTFVNQFLDIQKQKAV